MTESSNITDDMNEQLIECVKQRPFLWNKITVVLPTIQLLYRCIAATLEYCKCTKPNNALCFALG